MLLRPQQVVFGEKQYLSPKPIDHPLKHMEHRGIFDSGCSGHMTGNRAHLEDYQELSKEGSVTFGGSKGSISGKGTIRLGNLVFDDVAFVKELGHFNLFSISQICDKKLNVLFTEKECFVVSSDFKMPDENQVLLKVPRQHNMYTFDMKNVDSSKGYTCLLAKASSNEAKLWHRRLGHLNFKNLNKLVKGNLVRGLPSKSFKNDHTCVACQKGKQHKASCKAKIDRYVTHPLHTLHMDLFGPTSVRSINHASYCLVITDDCSRFCWVFFLAKKDETSNILKTFIRQIENQLNQKVKIIRSDNGTEFKNRVMLEFCGEKGIKQEFSNARTPQQNGVAERMNRTLIEAARTMLADSHLPTTFWAEAVNTACYTFNRESIDGKYDGWVSLVGTLFKEVIDIDCANEGGWQTSMVVSSTLKGESLKRLLIKKKGLFRFNNLPDEVDVPTNPTLRIHNAHPQSQILGDPNTPVQTRSSLKKITKAHALVSYIQANQRSNHKDQQHCLFACFSQFATKESPEALEDGKLGFKLCRKNSCSLNFNKSINQMDVKSAFLYGTIDEESMSTQPPSFVDPEHPTKRRHGYKRGTIDKLYSLRRNKKDIMSTRQSEKGRHLHHSEKLVSEILKKFDVTPKTSHLNAVKRIFKYLKGKPNLGLWYPKDSPLNLEAFSDSDYGGSNLDRKSTTGGCQFLVKDLSPATQETDYCSRLHTEAEYVAGCKLLWTTKHIGDSSPLQIIIDGYEKKLISVEKIHTDLNVADLLTKPFDGPRFNYLVVSIADFGRLQLARDTADGTQQLDATIDTIEYTITEESVRRQLQLADASGIHMLQNEEIFAGLQNIGSKSGGWDQFGSNIAIALICLSTGRDFNFSKLIFDGMISNLKSKSKFLMYPRQPQPSADPTPSQSVPATSSSHVQITQPPPTLTHSVQPPPQPSSVQPTATTPPTQPVQTTSPPPVSTIPDIQPTLPPSPQIPSPSYHDTEGPSFEPSYHMSPPPSHEPEIQASRSSEESEQLRNLMDIVPRLESRVKSLEKELSETKQTLGTEILQLIEKVKKLENKLRKKKK
ncbi:putative ribonuclease H-like domain-containing protein [Tanacetum coccineum]